MMKKLAVTIFALSLAAIGCGSDSGTPAKRDSSVDTRPADTQQQPDLTIQTDVAVPGPEVQVGPETQPDRAVDNAITPVDGPGVEARPIEVQPGVEVQRPDTTPLIDGAKRDVQPTIDVEPVIDGGVVDAPAVG